MRIELRTDVQAPEGEAVGLADGAVLAYVGRIPHIGGRSHRQADLAPFLAEAVDEAATAIWGGEWNSALSRVTGLNRRTVTRDRIEKFGLPSWVLALLGKARFHPFPRALGHLMLGVAELNDRGPYAKATTHKYTAEQDRDQLTFYARRTVEDAVGLVFTARDERSRHRVSQTEETNP